MSITLLKPFNLDTTANYTFNQVIVTSNVDLSGTAKVTLGNVSNIVITGGSNTQVLSTDGTGNLSWVDQSGGGSSNTIVNGTSNVNIATTNGNITIGVNGTPNIVVISNTETTISGNINSSGNITALSFTSNVATGTSPFVVTSTTQVANLNSATAGAVTSNAQPNITTVGTLTSLTVTGNVSANNYIGNGSLLTGISAIVNGNSNVVVDANANIRIGSTGNANVMVVTGTGVIFNGNANVVGTLTTSGSGGNISGANNITANTFTGAITTNAQPNITSVGNLTSLTVTGNITSSDANLGNAVIANYFVGNFYGTANTAITATTATSAASATVAATVTTNAQPNITSVGTLTQLTVTGNISLTGANVSLGNVSNLKITGGSNAQVLSTDGTGNLSWVAQSGGGGGGAANIVIRNEGNILTNSVSSIDFVGSSVDATVVGNAVTVTVSGGGTGGEVAIYSDIFTGNGVQTAFVLSTIPNSIDSTFVNIDGVSQLRTAYTVSGSTLTFTSAPIAAAEIEVTTIQSVISGDANLTTRNYTGNGVQNTFTVTSGVTATSLLVTENGVLQTPVTDYTVSSANLIFATAPANGVNIQVRELKTIIPDPVGEGLVYSRSSITATAGQTNFAVAYSVGYLQVFLNGVLLNAVDYTATTGATIVLNDAASAGDILEIITYNLIPFNQVQTATYNSTNLTSNMVITAGYSAVSVGPMSIANGVTISIASGQKWVIL